MKKRQLEIVRQILENQRPVSVQQLMKTYNKSERSIRYDVLEIRDQLNQYGIVLKNISGEGYYIDKNSRMACRSLLDSGRLNDSAAGNTDIAARVFCLLYVKGGYMIQNSLAIQTACSKGTLNKALKEFNESSVDVQFEINRNGVCLTGNEYSIRNYAVQQISLLRKVKDFDNSIQETIQKKIRKINEIFDVWSTAEAFNDLSIYCEAVLYRSRKEKMNVEDSFLERDEKEYAAHILKELGIEPSNVELSCMIQRMTQNGLVVSNEWIRNEQIFEKTYELVSKLLDECSKRDIWVAVPELTRDLARHMAQLSKFLSYGIELPENPMLMTIETNYSEYYEIAKRACKDWTIYSGKKLSDSEISYVAIYLYCNSRHRKKKPVKVLVVCATGKGLSSMIASKIVDRCPDIEVIGVENAYQADRNVKDAEFIISTVPLKQTRVPVITVSPLLTSVDLATINSYIKDGFINPNPVEKNVTRTDIDRFSLKKASECLDSILMAMLDMLNRLPVSVKPSNEVTTAILIHLCLALSRWCSGESYDNEDASRLILERNRKRYPEISRQLDGFFEKTETILGFALNDSEKAAFYAYIVREE